MIKRARVMVREEHLCHHPRCEAPVPEARFACPHHWYKLPKRLRDGIWAAYVPGQEITKTPTRTYMAVAMKCIEWWNEHE